MGMIARIDDLRGEPPRVVIPFRLSPLWLLSAVLALAAVLALPGIALPAAPPPAIAITAPSGPVQPGSCVRIAVTGLTAADLGGAIAFALPGPATVDLLAPINSAPFLHFTCQQPGRYGVAIVSGKRVATAEVTVGGAPTPDPTPGPGPTPGPSPKPDPSKLWLIIVEESSQRTPQQAAVILSKELRSMVPEGQFRVADKDAQVTADLRPWLAEAAGKTLPRMFINDAGRDKMLWAGDLPATVGEAKKIIGEFR